MSWGISMPEESADGNLPSCMVRKDAWSYDPLVSKSTRSSKELPPYNYDYGYCELILVRQNRGQIEYIFPRQRSSYCC